MERRNFVKNGVLAGMSLASFSLVTCQPKPKGKTEKKSSADEVNLDELTILQLQEKVKGGQMTYVALTQVYLKRIQEIDKSGPFLNSVIEINPDALAIAEKMDQERKEGKMRGPLHGIPILIKDNINSGDKMQTTAGSLALLGNIAKEDAFMLKKLRDSGVVLLGKTNLSEWANFRSTRSTSGWSSRGGQTRNPYILDRSPCGSSSGSGAAVSANLCAVAIGTETDGSIACPASMNGVVGIKPTIGLVSRSGIIPISKSQDTAGPLARTVSDAALLLNFMAAADPADESSVRNKGVQQDYTRALDLNALKGKRIGVEKSFLKHHEGIDKILKQALLQMEQAGATIVEVEFMKKTGEFGKAELEIMEFEFKDGLNKYLASANGKVKSLKELIEFDKQNESSLMPFFKQEILEKSELKGGLESKEYTAALEKLRGLRVYIDQLFASKDLDALCGPATGTPWCNDLVNGDFWTGYGAYTPAAITGYPSITVPMGFVHDLPLGLSFIGQAFQESAIISIGYAYEQASKNRKPPKFLSTLKI
ncbi:MAG TPA: amidase [Prolixibacteraceae bacterium]